MPTEFWKYSRRTQRGHQPRPETEERRQAILTLRYREGKTIDEIAEILDCHADTVKAHIRQDRAQRDDLPSDGEAAAPAQTRRSE